jgi:hypothetical protein
MRFNRVTNAVRPAIVGAVLIAVMAAPFIVSDLVGAISPPSVTTSHTTLTPHATVACGPVTFEWNTDDSVTYFQVHALGVSCAVAKNVVIKGGKFHGKPPAGWTYVTTSSRGNDCDSIWKHGNDRVTSYTVNNGEGC